MGVVVDLVIYSPYCNARAYAIVNARVADRAFLEPVWVAARSACHSHGALRYQKRLSRNEIISYSSSRWEISSRRRSSRQRVRSTLRQSFLERTFGNSSSKDSPAWAFQKILGALSFHGLFTSQRWRCAGRLAPAPLFRSPFTGPVVREFANLAIPVRRRSIFLR